jgi:hypothetical protein
MSLIYTPLLLSTADGDLILLLGMACIVGSISPSAARSEKRQQNILEL